MARRFVITGAVCALLSVSGATAEVTSSGGFTGVSSSGSSQPNGPKFSPDTEVKGCVPVGMVNDVKLWAGDCVPGTRELPNGGAGAGTVPLTNGGAGQK